MVGTPAGHATVPAGVMEATPPDGLEVVAEIPVMALIVEYPDVDVVFVDVSGV